MPRSFLGQHAKNHKKKYSFLRYKKLLYFFFLFLRSTAVEVEDRHES